ncbi:hypothetical protein NDU88_001834 [Pleurodeles waltl]|uniref:Uncharacterized protein n=1 Tax=Pleurodeles waltl TaxID=8319 RepID=A0AAV7U8B1_PLEWA|nr:hypothetical protein NDU88_001834 [Pleurodeles waltl]
MGLHRQSTTSQGNTIEQYTTPVPLPQCQTQPGGPEVVLGAPGTTGELFCGWNFLQLCRCSRVAHEGKIETVAVEVNLLQADLRKFSEKIKVAEGSIVELQTEVGSLHKQMLQVNSTVGIARLKDAECRSHRNNIRLLGFLERAEGAKVEGLVESWIKDVLQPVGLSRVFVVERAHKALVAPPRPDAPLRAIIARLLKYKDRDCILRAARESERAFFENCKISIYPDYTNKVQTSRKGFMEVKAKLHAMNA